MIDKVYDMFKLIGYYRFDPITDKEVCHIKLLLDESTLTERHIGEMFGVSCEAVNKIKRRLRTNK